MFVVLLLAMASTISADDAVPPGYELAGTDLDMNTLDYLLHHLRHVPTLSDCATLCDHDPLCVALSYAPVDICRFRYIRPCQTGPMLPARGHVVLERNAPVTKSPLRPLIVNALCCNVTTCHIC